MIAPSCEHGGIDYAICARSSQGLGSLVIGPQFDHVIGQLRRPSTQYPSLGLFLGQASKEEFLKDFITIPPSQRPKSSIELHVDDRTRATKYPLYVADVKYRPIDYSPKQFKQCHVCEEIPISWAAPCSGTVVDNLVARLLLPNTDVVCIFADDCGGVKGVTTLLDSLLRLSRDCQTPRLPAPDLIISGASNTDLVEYVDNLRTDQRANMFFNTVRLQHPQPGELLQRVILSSLRMHRELRLSAKMLFNATHQYALLKSALHHFCKDIHAPFDICLASVPRRVSSSPLMSRIEHVYGLAEKYMIPKLDVYEVIASALLFTMSSHKFEPDLYFDHVLRAPLSAQLARVSASAQEASVACDFIARRFSSLSNTAALPGTRITTIYTNNVTENTKSWCNVRSTITCLCCLNLPPEHILSCGHGFCDSCVRVFGQDMSIADDCFETLVLDRCMVCGQQQEFHVRLKPPTAGVRILSIDGGGIKGIVPLEILKQMQSMVGESCDVRDLFDLCIGTSAGGLAALKIFLQDCPITDAITAFKELSCKVFQAASHGQQSFLGTLTRIIKSISRDELYDSARLDRVLMEQFGARSVLGYNPSLRRGTRVGVVATAISKDTSAPARVFANYNGPALRSHDTGYRLQRSEDAGKEALVWQAARATSAAPGFFRPLVTSCGAFMDGCMSHNNPVNIALWECRVLWPAIAKPDVVVSLGTGNKPQVPSPTVSSPKLSLRDAFPFRVAQSFWSSMDGQVAWRDLMNRLDDTAKKDFFRLSVEYTGLEPALDNYSAIDSLVEMVTAQLEKESPHQEALMALLISSFYFELESPPKLHHNKILCVGYLKCRIPHAVHALQRVCEGKLELFNGDVPLSEYLSIDDLCKKCGRYVKKLTVTTNSTADLVDISVRWDGQSRVRSVGAMPQTVAWFSRAQDLDDVFETVPQPLHKRVTCAECPFKALKRRCSSARKSALHKRSRLK